MMLWRNETVKLKEETVIRKCFLSSRMGRDLLTIQACVNGVEMTLMTSHLESMKDRSEERKRQLQTALDAMKEAPADHFVIFAGDMNLRDYELDAIGGLPDNTYDLWQVMGSQSHTQYTWDMKYNDNKQMPPSARCRFDRFYFRDRQVPPQPPLLEAISFELVGKRRTKVRCFPSDHWGILADFRKMPQC